MEPILRVDNLEGQMKRDVMLVDISVPRNIDDKELNKVSEPLGSSSWWERVFEPWERGFEPWERVFEPLERVFEPWQRVF